MQAQALTQAYHIVQLFPALGRLLLTDQSVYIVVTTFGFYEVSLNQSVFFRTFTPSRPFYVGTECCHCQGARSYQITQPSLYGPRSLAHRRRLHTEGTNLFVPYYFRPVLRIKQLMISEKATSVGYKSRATDRLKTDDVTWFVYVTIGIMREACIKHCLLLKISITDEYFTSQLRHCMAYHKPLYTTCSFSLTNGAKSTRRPILSEIWVPSVFSPCINPTIHQLPIQQL